jgi:prepilin-type processing-associated H-X9-DG protein
VLLAAFVLGSMIYPVLGRERGRRIDRCLSNAKNLALAVQMYLADNDDWFPRTDRWVAELEFYVKGAEVPRCPQDESEAACSYGMNQALHGMSVRDIAKPPDVVVFFETERPGDNPVGGAGDVVSPGRHLEGSNYGFADGHAAWSETVPSFGVE